MKLHLPHRGSVPFFSHRRAITVLTLAAAFQVSSSCSLKNGFRRKSQRWSAPSPCCMSATHQTHFCALYVPSQHLLPLTVFQSRSLKLNLCVPTQGSNRKMYRQRQLSRTFTLTLANLNSAGKHVAASLLLQPGPCTHKHGALRLHSQPYRRGVLSFFGSAKCPHTSPTDKVGDGEE